MLHGTRDALDLFETMSKAWESNLGFLVKVGLLWTLTHNVFLDHDHRFALDWASELLRKSGICPHPCCKWSLLKTCPILPRFIQTVFSFQFMQSLHLKSLARSTPDQRPRVHSQFLHFLIKFLVSLTSVSKLATTSLHPGALQSFGFPNESLVLVHCFTTPVWVWPKP